MDNIMQQLLQQFSLCSIFDADNVNQQLRQAFSL
jgi:hypothetical protein